MLSVIWCCRLREDDSSTAVVGRRLYDVLRSHDCEGAKCYTTHLFIGSQSILAKLLITTILFSSTCLCTSICGNAGGGGNCKKDLKWDI